MKLLICGDSFAADWTVKYAGEGWPNMLATQHKVTNVAQAGCGEYKILKQLQSQKLQKYDAIVISHTSPYRVHTLYHPIHNIDSLHGNSDFIYSDVKAHGINSMTEYFEEFFDLKYATDVHSLLCEKINTVTSPYKTIHITHFDWLGLYPFPNLINFNKIHSQHSGNMNHYTEAGNLMVYNRLKERLDSM